MTITNENFKKVYTGSGTSVFAYDFRIDASDEISVQQYTISSGATVTLTETTDYTVSDVGEDAGGNVTLTAGSFPSGLSSLYKLILTRNVSITQETDYVENDPFGAETHEAALDKLTMIVQQQQEAINRAVIQDPTATSSIEFPGASADKIIGWNSGGTALENKTATDISSEIDITLGGSDAGKLVGVNATSDGYAVKVPNDYTDTVITASDEILFGDVTDSNNIKKDTVQGILDLVPADAGFTKTDIIGQTDTAVAAGDSIVYSDTSDSDNLKKDTVQGLLDLVTGTQFKVGNFSRDVSTATGTQAITGVGFQPSVVIAIESINDTASWSVGFSDGTSHRGINGDPGGTDRVDTSSSFIECDQGSGNVYSGIIDSFDADGFTVSWTKSGSPTGTATISYLAIG